MSSLVFTRSACGLRLSRRACLGAALGIASLGVLARPARDAAPLVLATEAPVEMDPNGWLVSEKLDGARAWWDGSRLRFRSGLFIAAPAWFTAALPSQALDGELWAGRGTFEMLSGIVRRAHPVDADWRRVRFMVFELPGAGGTFAERVARIERLARQQTAGTVWQAVEHTEVSSREALKARLDAVVVAGGEGLMLRRADAPVETGRSGSLLKLKPLQDAEAVVIGYAGGQGRLAGRLGALKVRMSDGRELLLGSGLREEHRDKPPPIGTVVTFTYQGTTAQGVPRFATFLRVRSV